MTNQRVKIVFEETGPRVGEGDEATQPFKIYMEGGREGFSKMPLKDRTAAEFYASKMFDIITGIMAQTGTLTHIEKKPKGH